ncbi:oligoendopeptidase F [Ureaplasma canigenitalium]|uniref:oligoendopeptidase F n=1 Tax=Ureaplasma canigenitalium TaxID=42092 RepID=UPI00068C22D7|nr:oligoendopeptidase F [Ureaplasma canigenitalium]
MKDQYNWDLDDLLKGKTLEDLFKEWESMKDEYLKRYQTFLDNVDNFYEWQLFNEKFTIVSNRLYNYISNNYNMDVADPYFNAMQQKLSALSYDLQTKTSDYKNKIIENASLVSKYLEDVRVKPYKMVYDEILRYQPHTLDKEKEKLYTMLTRQNSGFSEIFGTFTDANMKFADAVDSKGKKHKIENEAKAFVYLKDKDRELRKSAYLSMYGAYYDNKDAIAKMLYYNYLYLNQEAMAKNYEDYIARTCFDDHVSKGFIEHVYEQVKKYKFSYERYQKIRKAFLKKLLNVTKIEPWDANVPLINKKIEYTIEQAKDLALKSLSVLGEEYVKNVKRAFDEHWVSWLPKKNKRGGAYSIGGTKGIDKIYVLMNFDNSIRSVQTIVHEIGHSMHSLYSNKNQPIYNDYEIFYAEIASVSNEVYFNYYMLKEYQNDLAMKVMILDEMISSFFATTTRQVEFSNFEWIANELINNGKPFNAEVVMKTYEQLNYEYTNTKPRDKFHSIYSLKLVTPLRIPHFYAGIFYVYKYAIGQVCGTISGQRIYENKPNARENVFNFLSSGGSREPLETIKLLDIDLSKNEPWEEAHQILDSWIDDFEKSIKLLNKKSK